MENSSNPYVNELIKKFDFIVQDISQKYLHSTNLDNDELEYNIDSFNKKVENRIQEKCSKEIENMLNASEIIVKHNSSMSLVPKNGDNQPFLDASKEFELCSGEIYNLKLSVENMQEQFKKLNNTTFSNCIINCKNDLVKGEEIKFDQIKFCLKDCYHISNFNFKGYRESMNSIIEMSNNELEKL